MNIWGIKKQLKKVGTKIRILSKEVQKIRDFNVRDKRQRMLNQLVSKRNLLKFELDRMYSNRK